MFICAITGKVSKLGEKCNKIVIATREKTYKQFVWEDDVQIEIDVARGFEIVKEVNATAEGVEVWNRAVEDGTYTQIVKRLMGK